MEVVSDTLVNVVPAFATPGLPLTRLLACNASDPWFRVETINSHAGLACIGLIVEIAVDPRYTLIALFEVVLPSVLKCVFMPPLGPIDPPRYVNPVGPVTSDVVCVSHPDRLTGKDVGEKSRVGLPETYVSV